jgi:alkanesulfonate monooxygenase
MKFGVVLPLFLDGKPTNPARLGDLAQAAEALGYESIWLQDGPLGPGVDAPTVLAALAVLTRRVRLGFSILVLPQREAVVTARTLATIDQLSSGRLVAGVGVGSARERSIAYDVANEDRGRLMDEQIDVMRRLWRGERVEASGRWVNVAAAEGPPAVQDPVPVHIGTWGNEGGLRRVVRSGQGWLASGIKTQQDRFAKASARLDELCAEAGRDPDTIERGYVNCPLALAGTREEAIQIAAPLLRSNYGLEPDRAGVPFVGTPDDARRTLEAVQPLRLDLVCVFPQRLEERLLEQFRDEVAGGF